MSSDINKHENCSIGKINGSQCHKKSYTQNVGLTKIDLLSKEDKKLLILRSGIDSELLQNVCEHHKIYYLNKFESYQTSCFDPYKRHKKKMNKGLSNVSLEFSEQINYLQVDVRAIPGFKICTECRKKIQKDLQILSEASQDDQMQEIDDVESIYQYEKSIIKDKSLEEVNTSLADLGESPIKFHSMPMHAKAPYAKRKLESACSAMTSKVNKALDEVIPPAKYEENIITLETKQKAKDMDALIINIKEKLKSTCIRREKIQILTLAPTSWSRKKVKEEFEVSDYSVRQARNLAKEKGILALPQPRIGKVLSEETISLVHDFYQNDEFSRILPGKKDHISISTNVYRQKRLLLLNLRELYSSFKLEYPHIKVGLSKFCSLRPKWCVLAGSAGTHSVCVCKQHQNVILLLQASCIEETYKELFKLLVCSTENKDCMLGHCQNCPSSENLKNFLHEKFEDWDPDDEISYSSWVSTDRTQQIKLTVSLDEYISISINSLKNLIPHSYISKIQSKYLKALKENLNFNTAIILLDFSENYSYVIQDEVQGYHWTRDSCSLHPVLIYTRSLNSMSLVASSLCIISDDLEHDVAFVYETQKIIVNFLRSNFPNVTHVNYFSDGCAGQYKNCKNFINICHHNQDFNLTAIWTFFATSHGKSPCDGIGGTVKRLVARESLQNTSKDVIDTADKVMSFCAEKIDNIRFWLLKQENLSKTRQNLESRFSQTKTIPGTRNFHHFVPLTINSIGAKRCSMQDNYDLIFNFYDKQEPAIKFSQLNTNTYIACVYDNHWFFGVILSKHEDEGDIQVKFMHPFGPAPSFHWPSEKEDICYVPVYNVISKVSAPVTKGSGRVYYFLHEEVKYVEQQYMEHFCKPCH